METKSDKYQICVLEGVQQGSRQSLRTAQAQLVGNSFDCDIYLHDDSEIVHQVQILPGRFSIGITLVSGEAVLDSTPMVVGQKYKLSPSIPVRLGESLFTVETLSDQQTLADVSVIQSARIELGLDETLEHGFSFDDSAGTAIPDMRLISRLYRPGFLVLLVGFGLVGAVFAAWMSGPISKPAVSMAVMDAQVLDAVDDHALAGTDAIDAIDATSMANATGSTNATGLTDATGSTDTTDTIDVKNAFVDANAAEIENSVIDVFRSYGVTAEASSSKAGFVTVKTRSTNVEKLTAAEASANADVYGLKKLIVDFDLPPVENKEPLKKIVSKPADQEIRMIVIGNPTYVVAADQERYFMGSKLPTGHRVADIRKGLVIVEKNGVTTQLKL